MRLLSLESIELDYPANTWQEAVEKAGEILVKNGNAIAGYVAAMVRMCMELGPYIVMTPGIAIPHARPEEGALNVGIAALKLRMPISFGNKDNDPVFLVIAFCTPNAEAHIELLSSVAEVLSQQDILEKIKAANNKETLSDIFTID